MLPVLLRHLTPATKHSENRGHRIGETEHAEKRICERLGVALHSLQARMITTHLAPLPPSFTTLLSPLETTSLVARCIHRVDGENLQQVLLSEIIRRRTHLFKADCSLEDKARLLSCSTYSSRCAFTALPHPHRGTFLSPAAWRISLALRLGLSIFPGTYRCPICTRRANG